MKKYLDIILFILFLIGLMVYFIIYTNDSGDDTYLCTEDEYTNFRAVRYIIGFIICQVLGFYYLKKNKQATDGDAIFLSMLITIPLLIISDYVYQIINLWNVDMYYQERTVITDKYSYETTGKPSSTIYSIKYFSPKNDSICISRISGITGYEEAKIWNSLNIGDSLCINHYQGRFWNVSKLYAVKEKGREPPE